MTKAKARATLYCSFCLKSDRQVAKLVGGPSVYICDGCIAVCNGILKAPPRARHQLGRDR